MAEKVPSEIQQVAQELDELQEKYTATVNQRVIIEGELNEIKKILETLQELDENTKIYKNVGNILFEENKDSLIQSLNEKKEMDELLLERYKKEEEKLKNQIQELQEKLRNLVAKYYQRLTPTKTGSGAS